MTKETSHGSARQAMLGWVALALIGSATWPATPAEDSAVDPAPLPGDDWPRSPPEARGLDGALLERLVRTIETGREYPDLHSLPIVRHGYLVV